MSSAMPGSGASAAAVACPDTLAVALRNCEEVEIMIEISAGHLERLRTPKGKNTATSDLTKQEIRTMEGKLIKHFSKQLAIRTAMAKNAALSAPSVEMRAELLKFPSLPQWLNVVGISGESKKAILGRIMTLEQLRDKTESELNRLLLSATRLTTTQRNEDLRRLSRSLQSLKQYTAILLHGDSATGGSGKFIPDASKMELHWDSWQQTTTTTAAAMSKTPSADSPKEDDFSSSVHSGSTPMPVTPTSRGFSANRDSAASSLSSNSSAASSLPPPSPGIMGVGGPTGTFSSQPWQSSSASTASSVALLEKCRATPPTTPPWSAAAIFGSAKKEKFPTTPPPIKKHSTVCSGKDVSNAATAAKAVEKQAQRKSTSSEYPLTKSKSQVELGNRIVNPSDVASSTVNSCASVSTPISHTMTSTSTITTATVSEHMEQLPRYSADSYLSPPSSAGATSSDSTFSLASSTASKSASKPRRPLPSEPAVMVEDDADATATGSLSSPSPFDTSSADSGGGSVVSSLQIPKSPCTPRSMGHAISHRFKKTLKPARCDHCSEYMFNGLKCKECKFKCHRDCESKVPPSCCLPDDFFKLFAHQLTSQSQSPILPSRMREQNSAGIHSLGGGTSAAAAAAAEHQRMISSVGPTMGGGHGGGGGGGVGPGGAPYPDSSSNTSSCNSSTPSSPAVIVMSAPTPPHSATVYPGVYRGGGGGTKFKFPDPPLKLHEQVMTPPPKVTSPNPVIDSVKSYDSDKTLSGSSGSAGTAYRLDSQDSTASVDDNTSNSHTWNSTRQPSVSLREWDIPYDDLTIGDKIGSGRFSTVHQGNWHGDVAIKILNTEYLDDEATLEAFRLDVSTFRKTRHENLILFMGACMNPPKLAIVTSLCKGNTLYTHLHLRKDKFPMNKLIIIAQQIAQGMSYLHHRCIIHKDLKTKNIFLENGHAIIADFGLVNVARRLCASHALTGNGRRLAIKESMSIPMGWLCYLAPEIMKCLRVQPTEEGEDLPFTKSSDMFAFGTVWYELLTAEWPWKDHPPESIIWLVGKGMKPSLANLQASRDVKDILLMCWTFKPEHRPDFAHLSNTLDKIPKKKGLSRSLSQSNPIHLSRSAESVF